MAKVKVIDTKAQLTRSEMIKFQLVMYCHFKKMVLSEAEYNCLTLLGGLGRYELTEFCTIAASHNIFKNTQTVRNCLVNMEKKGLILKEGKSKKKISIHDDLNLHSNHSALLSYRILYIES